jgi:pyridoxamine 5'-phosphate oxidase
MFETLDDVRTDCLNRLIRAPRDRKSPMHTPVIVTGDVDARVMVLRAFDSARWALRLHTDARSPKAKVVGADSRVAVLFYDKGAKIQIRARAIWVMGRVRPPMRRHQACRPSLKGPSPMTRS